ncbi:MAG TPA: cation diffusion facilitator family transporter, partial [Gemmatimonadaceae bacterium]|nr:cation diffusion facilitator family transporter [Gemmatimonadaceae bacterium]
MAEHAHRGIRSAQAGLLANLVLAGVKLAAGILGHSYALIADAIESTFDIFGSIVVWGGLRIASRPADENHPYGHGRAESIAAAVVALMLLGAALGITVEAIREIRTPHHMPAAFTLWVLAGVIIVKEGLFRTVFEVGQEENSQAVKTDAWHHRSDAITSAAAFIGIATARIGGPGWESADDWAALVAAAVILFNGVRLLAPAVHDLMDRAPSGDVVDRIACAARSVEGVCDIEKLAVRRMGTQYYVDLHVQADPDLSLRDAHVLSGMVKGAIRGQVGNIGGV